MDRIGKMSSTKTLFYLTMVSRNLVQIGSLVKEIQNLLKKYVQFYITLINSKTMANIKQNSSAKKFYFAISGLHTTVYAISSSR